MGGLIARSQVVYPAVNKIAKADEDRGLVFAWASISVDKSGEELIDHHGDSIDPETLEDAAYEHVLMFRSAGIDHAGESIGRLIESFVVTPDKLQSMGLVKDALPLGWWTGWKVDDPAVFQKIKSGEYQMMSIQGTAVPEFVDE